MVLRLILFFAFTFCVARLAAQSDTTILAPVEIYGVQLLKYSVGSKVQELATRNSAETLTDRLNAESSMYFKNYGNQQLSTISFRGTTASQTAVLWNGVNVNSPTLGLTDFSTIPVFLFDEVAVHFGASSALVGTDAIGGSIALKSSAPMFARELNTTLLQQAGSFGRLASGIKFRVSTDRWFFSTRLVYTKIENNFPYTSPAVGYRRTQENAAVKNTGFSKQLAYKINESQQLTLEGIYAHNFRENQPAVTNFGANETPSLIDG